MTRSPLSLRALGARIAALSGGGGRPEVAATLPEPVLSGGADVGLAILAGTWPALGHDVQIGGGTIWAARLPDPRLEAERQSCLWLDDLAALGNRVARETAQAWVTDWIRRHGHGSGPGWTPELAGRRAERWTAHAALLTQDLDPMAETRFWRALAEHQRHLGRTWRKAPEGLGRLRALAGLVWSGLVLPHAGHGAAVSELGHGAEELIGPEGGLASRSPEELAETLILLIWTARMLENAGQHAAPAHLAAIVRAVPVIRPLRLGDGGFARFHGGGAGAPGRLDQALAELRIGVRSKPRLAMGYCRLAGGRAALLLDAAQPPSGEHGSGGHAGTLAFEFSVQRQPLVVNAGPGAGFGHDWAMVARQTASHSTVEIGGRSSASFEARGRGRRGAARLLGGPSLVTVRQAQDATGQWMLATHDGYVAEFGMLHERRVFLDMRGLELRGEDILSVPDARARARFDRAAASGRLAFAARFHVHPGVSAELDQVRQVATLTLASGEAWLFRASGGRLSIEDSVHFDPKAPRPILSRQMVVRGDVVEYLGQVIWSFGRIAEAPPAGPGPAP
jgi:uncharacterized heparinase superfamily protein